MNSSNSKKILIVEDDLDISFALCTLLNSDGYAIDVANNGIEALDLIKKNGVPDLILLDMLMPKMDGWEFSRIFKENYGGACPIIVMTAAADARQRANEINAIDFINKPFNFETFVGLIKKHLAPREVF